MHPAGGRAAPGDVVQKITKNFANHTVKGCITIPDMDRRKAIKLIGGMIGAVAVKPSLLIEPATKAVNVEVYADWINFHDYYTDRALEIMSKRLALTVDRIIMSEVDCNAETMPQPRGQTITIHG
jgi:aconitase B